MPDIYCVDIEEPGAENRARPGGFAEIPGPAVDAPCGPWSVCLDTERFWAF